MSRSSAINAERGTLVVLFDGAPLCLDVGLGATIAVLPYDSVCSAESHRAVYSTESHRAVYSIESHRAESHRAGSHRAESHRAESNRAGWVRRLLCCPTTVFVQLRATGLRVTGLRTESHMAGSHMAGLYLAPGQLVVMVLCIRAPTML